jgi:outer membrane protein assembly factor BamD
MRFFISILLTALLFTSCSEVNKALKSKDYEYKLRMAEKFYVKKKYSQAAQVYEQLFPIFKGTTQFEDLFYKYAYCAYYTKDYLNAENLFKQFIEYFPNSPKAEEVDYMKAYTFYKQSPKPDLDQTNTAKTIGMMQIFINTHPGSPRNKEATEIIDKCREKLEVKEFKNASLYYNLGQFRSAAIAFGTLINNYPESARADEYKLMVIRAYYQFASKSIDEKKPERYEQVVTECNDFIDRYPESKLLKEVERFLGLSQNNLKAINNEQTKTATER